MADEVKDAEKSEAADAQTESSTLAIMEAKMAALQEGGVESNDSNSEAVDNKEVDSSETKEDESKPREDDAPIEKDDNLPMLPSGYRRAALAREYTNEEIDQYLRTKPDEAVARFKELFNDWQEQNSRWSDRGRQLAAVNQKASEADTKVASEAASGTLSHYDVKALIEEHGESEDLINALVTPLNKTIDQVNAVADRLSKSENFLRNTEETALAVATQEFLTGKSMESFRETYGTEIKDLTKKQVDNRMELFKEADIIAAGAQDHGIDITVQDALERAHILVSQGSRDAAIRQSIRESMEKRTKTLGSSHQKTSTVDEDQSISDEELVKRTEARQRKMRDK